MNLYFLNYNNYYNRQIKVEPDLSGYLPYMLGEVATNINFNPNDDIAGEIVVNRQKLDIGDYMLAVNEDGNIDSRWFIIEFKRLRNGQYRILFKRDVIADNYNSVIDAPAFIEKATLQTSDPMIFNNENMTFNQIKTSETLIKDATNCPWIVGYYAKTTGDGETTLSGTANYNFPTNITLQGDLSTWQYYNYCSLSPYKREFIGIPNNIKYAIKVYAVASWNNQTYEVLNGGPYYYWVNETSRSSVSLSDDAVGPRDGCFFPSVYLGSYANISIVNLQSRLNPYSDLDNMLKAQQPFSSENELNDLKNLNNKTISCFENGIKKYYKINVVNNGITSIEDYISQNSNLYNTLKNTVQNLYSYAPQDISYLDNTTFKFQIQSETYSIIMEEINALDATYNITTNRYHLTDAPYDMFAIPYGNIEIKNNGVTLCNTNKEIAFNVAMNIAEKYSGSNILYDIQLLPYCPVLKNILQDDNSLDVLGDNLLYSLLTQEEKNVGIIFNCNISTNTIDIPLQILSPTNPVEFKVQNECDMYRICSPNYSSMFEFSAAKNNGVNNINVDYTYKPYTPYIHLNINFKNLYGQDFNDPRGLICSGDFSLPIISDIWQQYELNNKNYQNIFNRQIENMNINNAIQRKKEVVQATLNTAQAAVSGVAAGGSIGGWIGGLIGGAAAGAASGVAGAADIELNDQLRREAIDYTKDQFGYELGNIKARADTLTKVSAFNANNKIFPVLEYYTCTATEKEALRNKLRYNGMTVMRIGTISEFIQSEPSYIKGQIIRIENLGEEYKLINEIANEMNKGVFI